MNDLFGCYILDSNNVPVEVSLIEWATFFENSNRSIKQTTIHDSLISTVFIGTGSILFETMVFNSNSINEKCIRTNTYEDALLAHDKLVAELANPCLEIF